VAGQNAVYGTASVVLTYTVATATSLSAAPQLVFFQPAEGVGLGVVSATLTAGGNPLSGQQITFSVHGRVLCTQSTNSTGVARCRLSWFQELAVIFANGYSASFGGSTAYAGSTASTPAIELR
jgi:hypothetical protein